MAFVTLTIGPTWRMQILGGLLDARGLPSLVVDDSLDVYVGDAPSTSRLQVPEELLETARTVVAEARTEGKEALATLRFGQHERFRSPKPLKSMLLDVAFWLTLFVAAVLVFSWLIA